MHFVAIACNVNMTEAKTEVGSSVDPTTDNEVLPLESELTQKETNSENDLLKKEVAKLREEIANANKTIHSLQAELVNQKCKDNNEVTSLKIQVRRGEEALRKQRLLTDKQLGEVIAHLLFLESKLKREQAEVKSDIKKKDELIRKQKYDIEDLTLKNERLVYAIKEHYAKKSKNGISLENGDGNRTENFVPPSPSPSVKYKSHKSGAFNSVKEKLWKHHRSSFDLTEGHSNLQGHLKDSRQYSSQENLSSMGKKKREARDKKCKSIAGYPDHSLEGLIPEEGEMASDLPTNWLKQNGDKETSHSPLSTNGFHDYDQDHLNVSPTNLMSATSMPILSQSSYSPTKERPHSISSIESLSPKNTASSPNSTATTSPSPQPTQPSESNPFKNLKTILKRKGSKSKKQKRSVSLSQNTNHEHQMTMKKHFEKYEMA